MRWPGHPTYVAFDNKDRLVGLAALNQAARNPRNTIFGIKRIMGHRWEDKALLEYKNVSPFRLIQGFAGRPMISVQSEETEKVFTAEEISSMILAELRKNAENFTGNAVKNAVIAVPAHFNHAQRCATRDAGAIAGLNVLRIINEPTAAALAFGRENKDALKDNQEKHILVFDLGGGTLDITIILMKNGLIQVKCTVGDPHLGGEDFDQRLVEYIAGEFKRMHKVDIFNNPRALSLLRKQCEAAKRDLSFKTMVTVTVDSLVAGIDLNFPISRSKFEDLNGELFDRCKEILERSIGNLTDVTKDAIDEIVLVGGSTRIPKIQEMLKEFFSGKNLNKTIHPDEAVAIGAAILANKLTGTSHENLNSLKFRDVTSLSLGVEIPCGVMSVVVPRNTPIPVERKLVMSTVFNDQTSVKVKVFEGERKLTRDNRLVGEVVLELNNIKLAQGKVLQIGICFCIDEDGILKKTLEEKSEGLRKEMVMWNDYWGLTAEEIQKIIEDKKKCRIVDAVKTGGKRLGGQDVKVSREVEAPPAKASHMLSP